jgi:alpha-galactosidase/6-phospho-beta-glucosidase family protein
LRRAAAVEATVEAAVTGNRKFLVEAMILDGGIYDYQVASKLADELIHVHKDYLPQFA